MDFLLYILQIKAQNNVWTTNIEEQNLLFHCNAGPRSLVFLGKFQISTEMDLKVKECIKCTAFVVKFVGKWKQGANCTEHCEARGDEGGKVDFQSR